MRRPRRRSEDELRGEGRERGTGAGRAGGRAWAGRLTLLAGLLGAGEGLAVPPERGPGRPVTVERPGPRRSAQAQRASLLMLLGAVEPRGARPEGPPSSGVVGTKLSRAALDHVGPEVPRLLVDIANHPAETTAVRVRALTALAFYPTPDIRSFLAGLLHEPALTGSPAGTMLRAEALRSLGKGFGEDAVEDLAALREDPSPTVRAAAAEGLGHTRSEVARQLLEAWLGAEPTLPVRAAIDDGLRRLRGY